MFAYCLLPSLLLHAFVLVSTVDRIYEDLYQAKVHKGDVLHLEFKDYKYSLPAGNCYGILYTGGFCEHRVASVLVEFQAPGKYPTVNITDSLDSAIVNREPPCTEELIVNAKIACGGLLED